VSAAEVRAFLSRHELLARRDLGQNFLCDERLAARLVELAGVEPDDTVIEIGTGLGILTRALAARARRVVTIEVDAGIVRALRTERVLPEHVLLVHADALQFDFEALLADGAGPVRLVANLPYSISAPLLRRLLDLRARLADWSVMLQHEVAARLLAAPGTRDYGSLAVLHRLCVELGKELVLSPGCFFPVPRVRSTFVRMRPLPDAPGAAELAEIERVARAAFAQRRKTLVNSLRGAPLEGLPGPEALHALLAGLGISPRARAESLSPEQFRALARALREPRP
jgi:16S rRNA (adenine1518-N6/adenine1519-N6)-dimethyltransferase